jgi:hypothetical protein
VGSSGMLRRVALVRTDVSEELSAKAVGSGLSSSRKPDIRSFSDENTNFFLL